MVFRALLDQLSIHGGAGTSITLSPVITELLRHARRHNPIIGTYRTMHELKREALGLPLLPVSAAGRILGQAQQRGPLTGVHEQTERNAVYLAVDDRPVEACPHAADAIIGANLLLDPPCALC